MALVLKSLLLMVLVGGSSLADGGYAINKTFSQIESPSNQASNSFQEEKDLKDALGQNSETRNDNQNSDTKGVESSSTQITTSNSDTHKSKEKPRLYEHDFWFFF